MKRTLLSSAILLILTLILAFRPNVNAQTPVIRAVLFFSPSCSHCHVVMEQVLPPLVEQYPGQLDIVGIDVDHPVGNQLYQDAIVSLNIPDDRLGVPTLIIGEQVLVGSYEIPEKLPEIIQSGLSSGGVDWPSIPGLQAVLASQDSISQSFTPLSSAIPETPDAGGRPEFINKFLADPVANTIAVFVLFGMALSCLWVIVSYLKGAESKFPKGPEWLLPLLIAMGMGVAFYLSFIEISRTQAVCGPVGDCNRVQESPYAYLFGVIPVGVLGLVGYASILGLWVLRKFVPQRQKNLLSIAIWGLAWFGVIFSIYLTFLEPFVIGATCAWCITSAILMTSILLATTQDAKEALEISGEEDDYIPGEETETA